GLGIGAHRAALVGRNRPAIAHLAAALRIERSAIQHDLDVGPLVGGLDARAAEYERDDRSIGLELVVAGELAPQLLVLAEPGVELAEAHPVLRELRGRPASAPLPLEELAEPVLVDRKPRRGRDLLGHLERKAVRVGETEGRVSIDPALALRAGASGRLVDHREALRERSL